MCFTKLNNMVRLIYDTSFGKTLHKFKLPEAKIGVSPCVGSGAGGAEKLQTLGGRLRFVEQIGFVKYGQEWQHRSLSLTSRDNTGINGVVSTSRDLVQCEPNF